MNVKMPEEAKLCVPVTGDMVAIIGENRKMLVFPLEQVAELTRGKGVRLQRYKDGGVADVETFDPAKVWAAADSAGRVHVKPQDELRRMDRRRAAQAGRNVPKGFPRSGRFSG